MNKGIIITLVAIVLLGGGFFLYKSQQDVTMKKENAAMEKSEDKMIKNSSSRYVEYSTEAYDQAGDKRRVLYFYASWCPICRPTNADFEKNAGKIPEDMVVIRVNYNDPDTDSQEKDLAKKYGITYQHTFVQIDGQGKQVTIWNGGQTDELLANIK